MKDEAKDAPGSRSGEGIYIRGPNEVNGKYYWIQEGGSNALWYVASKNSWLIGNKEQLGKYAGFIYSSDGSAGPLEANTWKYYNGDKWIDGSNIITISSNEGLNHFYYKNLNF